MRSGCSLREIRVAAAAYAERFDAALLDAASARTAVEEAARIEKIAATIKASAAARLAETATFRERGERSPAHDLARLAGMPLGQAMDAIETAKRLEQLPEVARAAKAGELSPQQASAIAEAATGNPAADPARLLDTARSGSLREPRDECERVKAAGDHDAEARRRRIHDTRHLRTARHGDGSGSLTLRDNPEVIAQVMAAIAPARDELFKQARAAGRHERAEALDADALVATVVGNGRNHGARAPGGTRSKILVRVDLDTLLRGYPITGEVCEIAGYGPVAVSAVTDLIATGNAFLVALATKGQQVLGVAHLGRAPTALQQSALEWINPTCAREGCSHVFHLERDHRHDWADTKITLLDWLDRLCPHDHDLKTLHGWALVAGTGKRPMVPPDDPRHPRHRRPPPEPALVTAGALA